MQPQEHPEQLQERQQQKYQAQEQGIQQQHSQQLGQQGNDWLRRAVATGICPVRAMVTRTAAPRAPCPCRSGEDGSASAGKQEKSVQYDDNDMPRENGMHKVPVHTQIIIHTH